MFEKDRLTIFERLVVGVFDSCFQENENVMQNVRNLVGGKYSEYFEREICPFQINSSWRCLGASIKVPL